jgi:hypothetical protein
MSDAEAYEFARFVANNHWDAVVADPRSRGADMRMLNRLWLNTHGRRKKG